MSIPIEVIWFINHSNFDKEIAKNCKADLRDGKRKRNYMIFFEAFFMPGVEMERLQQVRGLNPTV